ncbi:MAG: hypothetical protein ACRDPF_29230, partial [Streptosporangiaceae bacterium]
IRGFMAFQLARRVRTVVLEIREWLLGVWRHQGVGGRDVEPESLFERLGRDIEERPRDGAPDVVDDHVQTAERLASRTAQPGRLSGVAEISYHDVAARPAASITVAVAPS